MTITLSVDRPRPAAAMTVRVGQALLVRVAPPLGEPGSGSKVDRRAAVVAGGWEPDDCDRGYRCYAFTAARPGIGEVAAMTRSGCIPGRACILGLTALRTIYVVPRVCLRAAVAIEAFAPRRSGTLTVTPSSASGRTNRISVYALGSFTDSDPEPHRTPLDYSAQVNWGDGINDRAPIVLARHGRAFEIQAAHFYCGTAPRTLALTVSKTSSSIFHPGESVIVSYRVAFR